jgi:hypothetical protein
MEEIEGERDKGFLGESDGASVGEGLVCGSTCRAVSPDSNDCISRSICGGVGKKSLVGLAGESNDTPAPNGYTMMAGDRAFSQEERKTLCVLTASESQPMTSEKMSPTRRGGPGASADGMGKVGMSAPVTEFACTRPGGSCDQRASDVVDVEVDERLLAGKPYMSGIDLVLRNLREGAAVVRGLVARLPFLNIDGGSNMCMLIRERRLDRGGFESSFVGEDLGCARRSSARAADAAGAESSRWLQCIREKNVASTFAEN